MERTNKNKIRLAMFDVDGTLVDSLHQSYDVDSRVIAQMGGTVPSLERYREVLGRQGWQKFYATFGVGDHEKALALYYQEMGKSSPRAIAGSADLLSMLADRHIPRVAISVNSELDKVADRLQRARLLPFFERKEVYCEPDSKAARMKAVCVDYDCATQQAIYVGDTIRDMREAKEAGVVAVGIAADTSYNTEESLRAAEPNYLFHSLLEVAQLFT